MDGWGDGGVQQGMIGDEVVRGGIIATEEEEEEKRGGVNW